MIPSMQAAIRTLEHQKKGLDTAIRALRGIGGAGSGAGGRQISAAGRERIVEAQRKRWAAYHTAKKK